MLNGGINTAEEAVNIARGVGVPDGGGRLVGTMIGRAVHANPWGVLVRRRRFGVTGSLGFRVEELMGKQGGVYSLEFKS